MRAIVHAPNLDDAKRAIAAARPRSRTACSIRSTAGRSPR
jgi:hypothetical protein